jgi:MFS family permease
MADWLLQSKLLVPPVRAVGQVIHLLAMQSSTPLLVPEKHLARVAGMNQTLQGTMNIVAPPLGALLLGTLRAEGVQFWFVLTGVLTLCASALGLLISAVRQLEQKPAAPLAAEGQA